MKGRKIDGDWHPGIIPDNVRFGDQAYIETSYSFHLYRSRRPEGISLGACSSVYIGCMFDMGRDAEFQAGGYTLLNGLWLICDQRVSIGSHCLISWNVVIMDNYRVPMDVTARRRLMETYAVSRERDVFVPVQPRPVHIENNVWIGFDCCVLPGVRIGEGSIIGARSVVDQDVEPYSIYAGNPARFIRKLPEKENGVA
jgi:acetyltransferase-like isoleucine patch superfamily enzyme